MSKGYSIDFTRSGERDLDKLPDRDLPRVIRRIENLAGEPRPRGCKKIGDPASYRVRQGDYRIVYEVDDQKRIVTIFKIGHRRWRG